MQQKYNIKNIIIFNKGKIITIESKTKIISFAL